MFWRRLAREGAQRGPTWWLRYSPPVFGWAAALALPEQRRRVVDNLHRIRGAASPLRDALDTAKTFGAYAGCLAESLASGSTRNAGKPRADYVGRRYLDETAHARKGIVLATIHTGGWEIVGPLFQKHHGLDMVMAMEHERDRQAEAVQDEARRAAGIGVVRIGEDPLSSLPLLRHLQRGGVVALQIDRVPHGMRSRSVRLLDAPGRIPEGPLRLAELSGAPLLPVFCARLDFRHYLVEASPPIYIERRASPEAIDAAAQRVADAMTTFLRAHPTQWFDFGKREEATMDGRGEQKL